MTAEKKEKIGDQEGGRERVVDDKKER